MAKQQPNDLNPPADPSAVNVVTNEDVLASELATAKALIQDAIRGLEVCRSRPPYNELKPTINPLLETLKKFVG